MTAFNYNKRSWWLLLGVIFFCFPSQPSNGQELLKGHKAYLKRLALDTYACISNTVDSKTGLPFDNTKPDKNPHTSVTNIGFYMTSIVGAVELGLEKRPTALKKLKKLLTNLQKFKTWRNFPINWNHTRKLTRHKENLVSTVDSGNYFAGVIVVRQAFPELQEICDQILKVDWRDLYDPKKKALYGGYHVSKRRPTTWHYDHIGADSRMASFLALAMGQVPPESWKALNRDLEERYGLEYFKPGWEAGGLFLGYMSGIFLNEKGSLLGLSAGNFAKAQMMHQEKLRSPVWGWSASDSPKDGYLGFNALKSNIVTPHASVLAVGDFPNEVVRNLKVLENLGARASYLRNGKYVPYGFRDAIDFKNRAVTANYLMLDQTMIFLSLVNFLEDHAISKYFESYEPVRKTKEKLKDFKVQVNPLSISFPVNLSKHFRLKVIPYDVKRPEYQVVKAEDIPLINLQEWERTETVTLGLRHIEAGWIENEKDLGVKFSMLWDSKHIYIKVNVTDESLKNINQASQIHQGDLVEIYIDPELNGLVWGSARDFQLGLSPGENGEALSYLWFQDKRPLVDEVRAISRLTEDGYEILVAISWKLLKVHSPVKGESVGISVAVHDVDNGEEKNSKLNWYFKPRESKFILPKIILN